MRLLLLFQVFVQKRQRIVVVVRVVSWICPYKPEAFLVVVDLCDSINSSSALADRISLFCFISSICLSSISFSAFFSWVLARAFEGPQTAMADMTKFGHYTSCCPMSACLRDVRVI